MTSTITIQTAAGPATATVQEPGQVIQIHVMTAPGQPPMFAVFPVETGREAAIDAVRVALDSGALPSDANITDRVTGAIAAGTSSRITSAALAGHTAAHTA